MSVGPLAKCPLAKWALAKCPDTDILTSNIAHLLTSWPFLTCAGGAVNQFESPHQKTAEDGNAYFDLNHLISL